MRITIQIPQKPDLKVFCRPADPVLFLHEMIFQECGLFAGLYKLHFDDEELFGVHRLQDYGLKDGSVITLTHWNQVALNAYGKSDLFKLS